MKKRCTLLTYGEHIMHNSRLYLVKRVAHWAAHRDTNGVIRDDGLRPVATLELAKV